MEQLVQTISHLAITLGMWGYGVIFLVALLETTLGIGLVLPGSTILLLAGVAAAGGGFSLLWLLPSAALGGVLGDNINYYLGARYGRTWIQKNFWILTPTHFTAGRRFVDQHGAKSVLIGRFIPAIKEIIPFIAGVLGMRRKTFIYYNILGACGWALEWIGAGYLFGHALTEAHTIIVRIQIMAFLTLLIGIMYYTMRIVLAKTL